MNIVAAGPAMPVKLLLVVGGWALVALWRRRPRKPPVIGTTLPPVERTMGGAPRGGWHMPTDEAAALEPTRPR